MKSIKISVENNIAQITERPQRIIAGTVGLPVEYTFDSHWDGLVKYAVFAAGKKLMMFEIENTAVIPWEVLRKPGQQLMIGVYGENPDGTEALPTVWANAGVIRHGAVPGTAPGIPSPPPVWESIKNSIGELDELNTEHKETLVGAINEVADMAADKEVFVAEYEVTPIEEIVDAHNAGKAIVCKHGGLLLPLVQRDRNIATFSGIYGGKLHVIVNNDGEWIWTTDSYVKAVEVRNVDHDDTIPTVRAVWQKISEREEAIRTEVPLIANRVSTPSGYSFDKTYAEIKEAIAAGRTILLNNYDVLYTMSGSGPNYYKFLPFVTAETDVSKPGLKVTSSDVWSEVETGAEVMTEEKVKTLIEGNAPLLAKYAPKATDNTSYAEIRAAVDAKRTVFLNMSGTSLVYYKKDDNNVYFAPFGLSSTSQGEYGRLGVAMSSDGKITTFDTGYEVMTEEVVKTLIQENAPTPDWGAKYGEPGHIDGRTHYTTTLIDSITPELNWMANDTGVHLDMPYYVNAAEINSFNDGSPDVFSIEGLPGGVHRGCKFGTEFSSGGPPFRIVVDFVDDKIRIYSASNDLYGITPRLFDIESVSKLDTSFLRTETEINEGSSDDYVPTAKAVFNYVKNNAGGASEWSDLGESVTNLGDTLTIQPITNETLGNYVLVGGVATKVSDAIVTMDDLVNGFTATIGEQVLEVPPEAVSNNAYQFSAGVVSIADVFLFADESAVGTEFIGDTLPESGLYVVVEAVFGKEVTFTIPDYNFTESTIKPVPEKYLPDSVKGGGVSSYNELTDVPCGVSDTLTHCVTNDRFYDSTGFYVKVGEFVNPSEFIANGVTITRFPDGAGNQASATYNECESDINGFAYIVGTENVDAVYFVTAIAAELGEEINGKTFPKAGIYFYLEVESVTAEGSGIGVKTLDVKYINTTTEITEASTDEQIPTAKAVFDHVKNNVGSVGDSNIVVVGFDFETMKLDHTPAEMAEMANSGKLVLLNMTGTTFTYGGGDGITTEAKALGLLSTYVQDGKVIMTYMLFTFNEAGLLAGQTQFTVEGTAG